MKFILQSTLVATFLLPHTLHAQNTPLPPARDYVTVRDGHLSVNVQRTRYWAAIGKLYIAPRL